MVVVNVVVMESVTFIGGLYSAQAVVLRLLPCYSSFLYLLFLFGSIFWIFFQLLHVCNGIFFQIYNIQDSSRSVICLVIWVFLSLEK